MATLNTPENIDSWCRTCMNETTTLFDVFLDTINNASLANILMSCTTVNINTEDGLPRKMCVSCYNNLKNFTEFRDDVEKVDFKFRELLKKISRELNPKGHIKVENEPIDTYENVFDTAMHFKKEWEMHVENDSLDNTHYEDENNYDLFVSDLNIGNESIADKKKQNTKNVISNSNENITNKEPYKCNKCHKKFKILTNYKKHMSKHKSVIISNVKVEFDSETINNNKGLLKSIKEEQRECSLCGKLFKSLNSLSAHMRTHVVKGRVLACKTCGKIFNKTSHLKRHEVIHLNKVPRKCSICPKSFRTENQLQAHMNLHNDIKPHICSVCNKAFGNVTSLTTHLKVHNRNKSYLCPTCGKRFDSSTNLNQHIRRHIGMKTFACSLCPKKFVSKGELKSHSITHTGERSYKCESCGAGFTKHSSLAQHKLRHLGLKPHQCDACSMKFTSKDHLKRHYRIHTGEKPYRCDMCERAFTQSNDLVKHQRGHLGDNMYKCSQCSESFRLKTELRQHISQHYISAQLEHTSTDVIEEPSRELITKSDLLQTTREEKTNILNEEN